MLNDLLTLTKIREGDIKAFEDVFRRYYSPLCWYAMSITGSMEAAEEIVEELFYGFLRDRERLPLFRSMKSYLYVAVRNQSFQYCEHLEVRNKYREFVLSRKGRTQDSNPQEDGSKHAFVHYPANTYPGQTKELKDNSHSNTFGAYELAKCIIEGMKKADLDAVKFLRKD